MELHNINPKNISKTPLGFAFLILLLFIFWSGPAFGQCPTPVTTCLAAHQTTIDLSTVPQCGSGTVSIQGDIQGNQSDCNATANSNWHCHQFIITRPANSTTQQFTLKVGQGAGCSGELDATYALINGVCTQLSNGGSGTVITFTFPYGVNTITLDLCLNSSAFVTICNLCAAPPPCTSLPVCNLSDFNATGCQSSIPAAFTNPSDVFTNTGTCGATLVLKHTDVGDLTFCGSGGAGVNFVRTYNLYFIASNGDTVLYRQCPQNIHVTPSPPVITPGTIAACYPSLAAAQAAALAAATATDCGGTITETATATGSCNAVVTVTESSSCGSTAMVTYNTSIDGAGPSITTCAAARTIDGCGTGSITSPSYSSVTTATTYTIFNSTPNNGSASDNCAITSVTYNDVATGSCPIVVIRRWTVSDACGNTATCNQTITVRDITPPVITSTGTIAACYPSAAAAQTAAIAAASATDNCSGVTETATTSGTCTAVVTVTETDGCGNTATTTYNTSIDGTAPAIAACAAARIIDGCSTAAITTPPFSGSTAASTLTEFTSSPNNGSASDNCGITSVNYVDVASATCPILVTRTWIIGDACGNTSTCNQTITVRDVTPPVVVTGTIASCYSSVAAAESAALLATSATDNCGASVSESASTVGTCSAVVTVTETDACGNTATTSYSTRIDNTPPTVITGSIATCYPTVALAEAAALAATGATDNCSGAITETASTIGTCSATVTVTEMDGCGNSATTTYSTRIDNTPPTITSGFIATCYPTVAAAEAAAMAATSATDNCTGSITEAASTVGTCSAVITVTETDDCGNVNATSYNTSIDNTPPLITTCAVTRSIEGCNTGVITNPPFSTVTVASSELVFESAPNNGNASDNCGISSVTYIDVAVGACPIVVTRQWTVSDACGNTSTCNQTINVTDTTAPFFTSCPANTTINCPSVPVFGTATAMDACDASVTITTADVTILGTCPAQYSVKRTWTAVDDCGNSATCSTTINVQDVTSPVIHCPADLVLTCDAGQNYPALINAWLATATATDACDANVAISNNYDGMSIPSFACQGGLVITFTATDDCGNTSTCTSTITKPCFNMQSWVYLEGAAASPTGAPTYLLPMRTTLNDLRVLPGQVLVDPFFGNKYSPPGQPYSIAPWNYPGNEGTLFDSGGNPMNASAGYPATVVDWILVSLRLDSAGTGGPVCQAAAFVHKDGTVQFVKPLNCCGVNENTNYYVVVEHRNHLIVMSHVKVSFINHTLSYDFRFQQSYEDPQFAGLNLFAREKEILPGMFAMFAGNGKQTGSSNADTDINFDDRTFWESQNGAVGFYRIADYNLNADTNFNDRIVWERNNGKFTSVPRN